MKTFYSAATELMILLPGMLCAFLPVKQYLRRHPARLAALMVPLLIFLSLAGAALHCVFSVGMPWLFLLAAAIAGTAYVHALTVSRWKSVSVLLAICATFSCMGNVAVALNDIVSPGTPISPLSPAAATIWFLMCCGFVAAVWHPSTHASRQLLEEEAFAQTWYVFWVLPILFIGLNLFLIPIDPDILNQGRIRMLYILISFCLLFLLLLFYGLFYLIASALNRNDRLRQENQFLSIQQARYDSLRAAIAQTRQARHDMRHHFTILQNLAGQKEWESLEQYLADAQNSLPDTELDLCDNPAADSVASHYGLRFKEQGIPFTFELDLPAVLPVPEMDLCLVMSNLLENALEASQRTNPSKRRIGMRAHPHSGHMLLLSVENTFDGEIRENNGILQSSKRRGDGTGLQSVRHIAEKNGGYCRFYYEDGLFRANVILRAGGQACRKENRDPEL